MSKKQYLRNRLCDIQKREEYKKLKPKYKVVFNHIWTQLRTKPCVFKVRKQKIQVSKGQFLISYRRLAKELNIHHESIRRCIISLQKNNLIKLKKVIIYNKSYGHLVTKTDTPVPTKTKTDIPELQKPTHQICAEDTHEQFKKRHTRSTENDTPTSTLLNTSVSLLNTSDLSLVRYAKQNNVTILNQPEMKEADEMVSSEREFKFKGLLMKEGKLIEAYQEILKHYYNNNIKKAPMGDFDSQKTRFNQAFCEANGIEKLCLFRGWILQPIQYHPQFHNLLQKNIDSRKVSEGYKHYHDQQLKELRNKEPQKQQRSAEDIKEEALYNKTKEYWDYLIASNRPEADRILEEANIKAAMISRSPMKKIVDSASNKGSLSSQKIIMSFIQIILQSDKTHLEAIKSGDFRVTDFDELKKEEAKNATIF